MTERRLPSAAGLTDGVVWYNEWGKRPDALVRFESKTETFQSRPISSGGVHAGIIRHMAPNRDGNLLIHQSSTTRITLVTLERLAATKWSTPVRRPAPPSEAARRYPSAYGGCKEIIRHLSNAPR